MGSRVVEEEEKEVTGGGGGGSSCREPPLSSGAQSSAPSRERPPREGPRGSAAGEVAEGRFFQAVPSGAGEARAAKGHQGAAWDTLRLKEDGVGGVRKTTPPNPHTPSVPPAAGSPVCAAGAGRGGRPRREPARRGGWRRRGEKSKAGNWTRGEKRHRSGTASPGGRLLPGCG